MKQQINLYQDVLVEKKPPLHVGMMARVLGGSILALLLVSVLLGWQQGKRDDELAKIKEERTQLVAKLHLFRMQNPPRQEDPNLTRKLEEMRLELAGRSPILEYFEQFEPEMALGFAPVIEGLARFPLKGVWLTGISLNTLDRQILLAGSATRAELIPTYLHHLGKKQVLKGQTFASLKLVRLKERARQVDFRLESNFGVADE